MGRRAEFAIDLIDPAAAEGSLEIAEKLALKRRVGRADAFIVVTPEYNHSYPAVLKALIDSIYVEWQTKPVAFVSYGGVAAGLRAVEHLRLVFAELHAVGIRDVVAFPNAWQQFDANGALHSPERAEKAMTTLLDRLAWWAIALRGAREASAYPEAA
ncbi:MAG: NADPH-dependent FMN reductase [Solimonas sp.]